MLVCHCGVVSDREIRNAIAEGAHDHASVAAACGAGQDCLGCAPTIDQLLDDAVLALREPDALHAMQADRRRSLAGARVA